MKQSVGGKKTLKLQKCYIYIISSADRSQEYLQVG